ncbi:hypothetical protein AC578_7843 [Pseudocercospora eumusae]|uniref:Rhodopsin domain-containing protein n=1 Tax=Pseudocercospora eumusae TaxID=321146 RepID=A0A139HJA1_9PEZI|nr:hypothetical protein AC578_7843 [Pseudocercospora eumusae]
MAATEAQSNDDDSKQLVIIVASVILMVISFVGTSLRLYARLAIIGKVFTEDILVVLGTFTALGLSSTFVTAAYSGLGKHSEYRKLAKQEQRLTTTDTDIRPEDVELLRTLGFVILVLYVATAILTKISFLTLYLRLDQRRPMRLAVYFLMCCIATVKITFMIVQSLTCAHPTLFWSRQGALEGQCWSPQEVQYLYNIVSILTIVVAAAIISTPLPMLHGLELPNRQRYAVCALFALGFLPIIGKCYYLWNLMKSDDINYAAAEASIWAQVELHMVILCSSASTFKVLMKGFFPSCSRTDNSSVDPFPELQNPSPTAWTRSDEEKFAESPTSTEGTRDRSWSCSTTADHPITDEHGRVTYARPPRVVLHRASGDKASTPARVLLRFPSIEDRLGSAHGYDAWMQEEVVAPSKREVDGQSWNYI